MLLLSQYEDNLASSFEMVMIYLFYYLAAANQALVVCSLFSNAKVATSLYGLFFVIQGGMYGWVFKDNGEDCLSGINGACDRWD